MSRSGKELNDLLSRLDRDIQKDKQKPEQKQQHQSAGINIVGNNNTLTIGDQYVLPEKSTNDLYTHSCKACGHIVAKAAKACIHCGQPIKKSKFKRHILLVAMLLAPLVNSPPPFFGFFH